MPRFNGGAFDGGRIQYLADLLYESYLTLADSPDVLEHVCVLAVFCDMVLTDIERAAPELNDFSVLPGEIRRAFLMMIRGIQPQ